jgi:hypothetical protein
MRVMRLRDGTWVRVVKNYAKNGASYLWFDPPKVKPPPVQSDLRVFASMFAGTP